MTLISRIRWNGLFLDIPKRWEAIVKDTRHLILEADLRPLLEIRWQPHGKRKSADTFDKIAGKFGQETGYSASPDLIDQLPGHLSTTFLVQAFNLIHAPGESALMLVCKSCTTTILIRLYPGAFDGFKEHPFVLDSLHCHASEEDWQYWRIQDFYFWIPEGYELDACSFRFGLTNLVFNGRTADLNLCRLAPATEHLKANSLDVLFESLCSAPLKDQVSTDPSTLRYCYEPHPAERIWSLIRRKQPYRAAALSHFPHHDRILGYTMRSRRPIEDGLKSSIENGYGIIQEKDTDTCIDQGSGSGLHTGQK